MNFNLENNPEIYQEKKNRKLLNRYLFFIFFIFLLAGAFWAGFEKGKRADISAGKTNIPLEEAVIINQDKKLENTVDFSLFWDVWDKLKNKYVDAEKLDAKKMLYGAIEGMLTATGDPYTIFLDPEQNKKFNEEISGSFEGIGAEMGIKNGVLTIIAPLEGAPAEKAGLRAGDKVLKINGEVTANMSVEEAVDKIRGPKGTEVKLTILRNGNEESMEIAVPRDVINVKSVKLEFRDDNIAYLKVSRFSEDTDKEFSSAVSQIISQNSKGIILDLRNNPGGFLDASVSMASKMIPKGKVAVIEENSKGEQKNLYTEGGDVLSQIYAVILINEGSASASEILAGALRDDRTNVTLVGKTSFGKGSVQELIDMPQSTAVKITVAKWLTPNGDQINNQGIKPDVEVDLTNDDYQNDRDPQLDKALEIIKEKISS